MAKGFLHRRSSLLVALALSSMVHAASADKVTLKSGEVLEGEILRETETEVVLSVAISSGILDERTIRKEEIESVDRRGEDSTAFESLKHYKIGRDSYPLAAYETMMRALETFLGRYPNSVHAEEIKNNLYALRDEDARVKKGEVKWSDRWYSRDEADQLSYQIAGQRIFAQMKEKVARGDAIAALNLFARLEKEYSGCRDYPDAVDIAVRLIPRVVQEAERRTAEAQKQQAQFAARIDAVGEPERSRLIKINENAIAREKLQYENAEKLQVVWKPILPLEERSLTALRNTANSVLPRLRTLNTDKMREAVEAALAVERALDKKDVATAEQKLKLAVTNWKEYERLVHLNEAIKATREALAETEKEKNEAQSGTAAKKS